MNLKFSNHAVDRINDRLGVTIGAVRSILNKKVGAKEYTRFAPSWMNQSLRSDSVYVKFDHNDSQYVAVIRANGMVDNGTVITIIHRVNSDRKPGTIKSKRAKTRKRKLIAKLSKPEYDEDEYV